MKAILAPMVLALAVAILWGIGRFARRLGRSPGSTWPVTIGLGLAVVIFLGGVLNLAHLARSPVLWLLAAAGALVAALELKDAKLPAVRSLPGKTEFAAAALVIILVTGFAIATQLPPSEFNSHDDFQKYFAHPVRMLETGSLLGSPLSALGSQTLGGQVFLHGFVLSLLPIGYINGVDAVFGLFVLMLMAAAAGWRRFGRLPGAMLGPLLVAVIEPQYVNVSSLYLGSVLMAAAVLFVAEERETNPPAPFVLGLLYASLVVLKTSFALFVLVHFPLAAVAIGFGLRSWKEALAWGVRVGVWTGLGAAPWFLLHLPNYLAHGSLPAGPAPGEFQEELNLFSVQNLYYGASFAHYTALVVLTLLVALCALVSVWMERDAKKKRPSLGVLAAAVACVISYALLVIVLGPAFAGYRHSLRYSTPTLLGCGVFALILLPRLSLRLPRAILNTGAAAASGTMILAFAPSMASRYRQAVDTGSILAFAELAQFPDYVRYNQVCLSPQAAQRIRGFQEKVPPGEPLLAWIDTPFLLDYARNPMVDVEVNGIVNSWAHIPGNVRYFLWQYRDARGFEGFGVRGISDYEKQLQGPGKQERVIAARALAFLNHLKQLSTTAEFIANDGELALFRIPDPPPPAQK